MQKIDHFMLPEEANQLYEKEARSSIGLTKEIGDKINELIDAYNNLSNTDLKWKQVQEGKIRGGILYMKDNLLNTLNELLKLFKAETFIDERVQFYVKELTQRLDNLVANVSEYTELTDIRVSYDGVYYTNAGKAVREQIKQVIKSTYTLIKDTIESFESGKLTIAPELVDGFIKNTGEISDNSMEGVYKRTNMIELPMFTKSIIHNSSFSSEGEDGYSFYDHNKNYISGGKDHEILTIPDNAKYFALTHYNLYSEHTEFTIDFFIHTDNDLPTIKNIKETIDTLISGHIIENIETQYGYVKYETGEFNNTNIDNAYTRTEFIEIPERANEVTTNFNTSSGSDGHAFYDIDYKFISGSKNVTLQIPDNAKYVMFTNYNKNNEHSGKWATFTIRTTKNNLEVPIKKIVSFGDSHVERGLWQDKVIDHFNIQEHVNLGIGSSTVAINVKSEKLPFIDDTRIDAIKNEDPDIVIIIGGTNDVHLDSTLGTIESIDRTTFYGAYKYLIETLLEWKAELKIVMCTVPQGVWDANHEVSYLDISKAIKEIGNYYSIPVADIFGKCGVNKVNLSTYSDDEIHYNALGNNRIAKLIIKTIENSYM